MYLGAFGKCSVTLFGALIVYVAQRDDVFGLGTGLDITPRLSSRADGGDIQLLVRRLVAQHFEGRRTAETGNRNRPGQQSAIEKVASCDVIVLHLLLNSLIPDHITSSGWEKERCRFFCYM